MRITHPTSLIDDIIQLLISLQMETRVSKVIPAILFFYDKIPHTHTHASALKSKRVQTSLSTRIPGSQLVLMLSSQKSQDLPQKSPETPSSHHCLFKPEAARGKNRRPKNRGASQWVSRVGPGEVTDRERTGRGAKQRS